MYLWERNEKGGCRNEKGIDARSKLAWNGKRKWCYTQMWKAEKQNLLSLLLLVWSKLKIVLLQTWSRNAPHYTTHSLTLQSKLFWLLTVVVKINPWKSCIALFCTFLLEWMTRIAFVIIETVLYCDDRYKLLS